MVLRFQEKSNMQNNMILRNIYKFVSPLLVLSLVLFAWPAKTYALVTIQSFTTTGTTTWIVPNDVTSVDYLVVGGGGGGGAGGFRTGTLSVTPGASLTVTVGAGGASETRGATSTFGTIDASGGGAPTGGVNGGSGAGTGSASGEGLGNTPSTSPSQGNNGGNSGGFTASGGG